MVSHALQILDADFARDQYARTRRELGEITLGFGYAHEWPASWKGPANIDSGPVIPVFNISAGSSGMAFIGASAFNDEPFLKSLAATLDFAAFPSKKSGQLKYCASNQVGDAALSLRRDARSALGKNRKARAHAASQIMSKFFSRHARQPQGPLPSVGYLLEWAGLLTALFLIANLAGLRQYTSVLNGTIGSTTLNWQTASFLGAAYVFVYSSPSSWARPRS